METLKEAPLLGKDGVSASTAGARLASVGGVDIDHPSALPDRLIFHEALELPERPVVEGAVQCFSSSILGFDSATLTDVGELLHHDTLSEKYSKRGEKRQIPPRPKPWVTTPRI